MVMSAVWDAICGSTWEGISFQTHLQLVIGRSLKRQYGIHTVLRNPHGGVWPRKAGGILIQNPSQFQHVVGNLGFQPGPPGFNGLDDE